MGLKNDLRARRASFVKKANKAHNNRYQYSNFLSLKQLVTCYCPVHEHTWKVPAAHHASGGTPCPKCSTSDLLYIVETETHTYVGLGTTANIINRVQGHFKVILHEKQAQPHQSLKATISLLNNMLPRQEPEIYLGNLEPQQIDVLCALSHPK